MELKARLCGAAHHAARTGNPGFASELPAQEKNSGRVMKTRKSEPDGAPVYSAEKARQGEIILRQPWQRAVFITGLAAAILLPLVVCYVATRF